ncbi:unnamed protein product [Moneuplotes crassus]|uniref:Uncharacterized protein n=1 Tax=Euplotes crassus TaxID=5936 RepID=A0AAD1U510_EUPCR|nr:unnamed protein product [Moneuplotes crassus]
MRPCDDIELFELFFKFFIKFFVMYSLAHFVNFLTKLILLVIDKVVPLVAQLSEIDIELVIDLSQGIFSFVVFSC